MTKYSDHLLIHSFTDDDGNLVIQCAFGVVVLNKKNYETVVRALATRTSFLFDSETGQFTDLDEQALRLMCRRIEL